ncbi:ABC transporter ATP-binding protein [Mesobacillus subterraneus]|jgi:acetoin utilization transport system ATP-binding protein|uniref:ABC transporter ATP-binding protein n=1 Tax=Mesobacillus subterraneus TaxID=285983 RepID=UPI0020407FCF|nr:ABC transporter ATP-binding protein [Mesobacillus subterraneus]MCM3664914.1 ABC transporter ATP-binding protein [Mesobacillus subterraneus]MCM3682002.1 ABC transporter ATP-binding protein [Mesobacillus subterraneus]
MITIKDISHEFEIGKKGNKTIIPVLKNVSFEVNKGEIVTIVGRSGSGKSTLLNLVSGFIRPKKGEIIINGVAISTMNESKFADFRIEHLGFIFQSFQLIPSMTAYQNVELPLILKGVKENERKHRTNEILQMVGLYDYKDHYPGELSGGQQQRVSIARALIVNPPIILADEPTGSLDSETEEDLLNFIITLNKELGITFLIITHDEKVSQIGHRTIELRDGRVLEEAYAYEA